MQTQYDNDIIEAQQTTCTSSAIITWAPPPPCDRSKALYNLHLDTNAANVNWSHAAWCRRNTCSIIQCDTPINTVEHMTAHQMNWSVIVTARTGHQVEYVLVVCLHWYITNMAVSSPLALHICCALLCHNHVLQHNTHVQQYNDTNTETHLWHPH